MAQPFVLFYLVFENDRGAFFGKVDREGGGALEAFACVEAFKDQLCLLREATEDKLGIGEGRILSAECHYNTALGFGIVVLENGPRGAVKDA